jgi:hypothetical protein
MTIDEAFTFILSAGAATDEWEPPAIMVSASSAAPGTASPAQSDS